MKAEALKYYEEGIECGMCILLGAAQKNCRVSKEIVDCGAAISNGFGIGIVCGCIISGILVINAVYGEEEAKKKRVILMSDFKTKFDNINCSCLCCNRDSCEDIIGFVCDWLEDIGI